jgi:hypothetical protein
VGALQPSAEGGSLGSVSLDRFLARRCEDVRLERDHDLFLGVKRFLPNPFGRKHDLAVISQIQCEVFRLHWTAQPKRKVEADCGDLSFA